MAWWVSSDARGLAEFLEALREVIAIVRRFPLAGRPVREHGSLARRSIRVGPYFLFYLVSEETVHLVLLQHVRRATDAPDLTLLR